MNEVGSSDYRRQWGTLRRRRAVFYVAWIGGALLALVLSVHSRSLTNLFGVLWIAGFFVAGIPVGNFLCPRCGELFFKRRSGGRVHYNSFTGHCLHCGLRTGQEHG